MFRKFKKIIPLLTIATFVLVSVPATPAYAKSSKSYTSVSGYTKHNGTKVQPYKRTTKDSTHKNNYDYKGNYNPWTGKYGTKTYSKNSQF
ncbi:hypothetical protein [Clostridium saccharoperbutylacetonicum]|uniref:hypothetical protein n=1 Tax=Clostridium saccharoperbutylacetonicum TaxID=36745 RepID=UPI00034AD213|nr:hypothetical protein [Clostridium saccharoperbutylacetonicum]